MEKATHRKLFVGGNWKSNNTFAATKELTDKTLCTMEFNAELVDVIVSPIFLHIPYVLEKVPKTV